MTDLTKLQHGEAPHESNPMSFSRPSLTDASRSTINEESYDPKNPKQSTRIKQHFNEPAGESGEEREYVEVLGS